MHRSFCLHFPQEQLFVSCLEKGAWFPSTRYYGFWWVITCLDQTETWYGMTDNFVSIRPLSLSLFWSPLPMSSPCIIPLLRPPLCRQNSSRLIWRRPYVGVVACWWSQRTGGSALTLILAQNTRCIRSSSRIDGCAEDYSYRNIKLETTLMPSWKSTCLRLDSVSTK
jgi:hypothetical protein